MPRGALNFNFDIWCTDLGGAVGARKTARRVPKPGNHCWGHLVKSSEGQLLGGSGRFWAHFDRKWGGLDAQPIAG